MGFSTTKICGVVEELKKEYNDLNELPLRLETLRAVIEQMGGKIIYGDERKKLKVPQTENEQALHRASIKRIDKDHFEFRIKTDLPAEVKEKVDRFEKVLLAQLLAHLHLHMQDYKYGEEYPMFIQYTQSVGTQRIESRVFAYALLMPEKEFKKMLPEKRVVDEVKREHCVDELAKFFMVDPHFTREYGFFMRVF